MLLHPAQQLDGLRDRLGRDAGRRAALQLARDREHALAHRAPVLAGGAHVLHARLDAREQRVDALRVRLAIDLHVDEGLE